RPTAVDLDSLGAMGATPTLFSSPASDAFTPQAVPGTHALLAHVLPRGTRAGIVTKGSIPEATLDLLARHADSLEGVAIGLSSLGDARNRVRDPGGPPARQRLRNIDRLTERGITTVLRMDPLFPVLDDDPAALESLVEEAAARRALGVTAT